MAADFFELKVEINFNRINPLVSTAYGQSDQDENGWGEKYYFPVSPGITTIRTQARNLVAARCLLLPLSTYIFRTGIRQASVYRSHYDLNGFASHPVQDDAELLGNVETCNDIDAEMLWRFEDGQGRRWNRGIRAIRDSWIQNMDASVGSYSYDPVSAMTAPQVPAATGVAAVLGAVTVAAGAVTVIAITSGGSGYTVAPIVAIAGPGTGATAHAVLTAGVVTSIVVDAGGTGYTSATATIAPPQVDPWGLPPNQTPAVAISNFLSCIANYTINFTPVKVANTAFPSGFMTQAETADGGPFSATRILFQKISNRQTGQIRRTNKARRKMPI